MTKKIKLKKCSEVNHNYNEFGYTTFFGFYKNQKITITFSYDFKDGNKTVINGIDKTIVKMSIRSNFVTIYIIT